MVELQELFSYLKKKNQLLLREVLLTMFFIQSSQHCQADVVSADMWPLPIGHG